ncbi:unannotated protein [freshwater metagenome]|uniref:Unannotated protein n=1 Tax=freshwater metagenome TaxID=449393 RepID=A0A6J6L7P2_9ZZZZ
MQVCACLGVHDETLAACFDVALGHHVRCVDHEVRFKWLLGVWTHSGDHVWPEGEVGDELAVHHVELDDVDASLIQCMDLFTKLGEISGQYRGGDLDRQRHGLHLSQ